jgi:hypothetical protein
LSEMIRKSGICLVMVTGHFDPLPAKRARVERRISPLLVSFWLFKAWRCSQANGIDTASTQFLSGRGAKEDDKYGRPTRHRQ